MFIYKKIFASYLGSKCVCTCLAKYEVLGDAFSKGKAIASITYLLIMNHWSYLPGKDLLLFCDIIFFFYFVVALLSFSTWWWVKYNEYVGFLSNYSQKLLLTVKHSSGHTPLLCTLLAALKLPKDGVIREKRDFISLSWNSSDNYLHDTSNPSVVSFFNSMPISFWRVLLPFHQNLYFSVSLWLFFYKYLILFPLFLKKLVFCRNVF